MDKLNENLMVAADFLEENGFEFAAGFLREPDGFALAGELFGLLIAQGFHPEMRHERATALVVYRFQFGGGRGHVASLEDLRRGDVRSLASQLIEDIKRAAADI